MDEKAHAQRVADERKRRAEREFRARQHEWTGRQAAEVHEQKTFDREFRAREAQVQSYYDGADAHARWLYGKSPTRKASHLGSHASPMASLVSEGAAESPL